MGKHWSEEYGKKGELEKIAKDSKSWSVEFKGEDGPAEFTNDYDDTLVTLVRFTPMNNFSAQYIPDDDSVKAMLSDSDRKVSYPQTEEGLEGCMEWVENYIEQHDDKNK